MGIRDGKNRFEWINRFESIRIDRIVFAIVGPIRFDIRFEFESVVDSKVMGRFDSDGSMRNFRIESAWAHDGD